MGPRLQQVSWPGHLRRQRGIEGDKDPLLRRVWELQVPRGRAASSAAHDIWREVSAKAGIWGSSSTLLSDGDSALEACATKRDFMGSPALGV